MFFKPQSDNLKDYLRCTEVIDFEHPEIMALSNELYRHDSEQDFICSAYEYVRDRYEYDHRDPYLFHMPQEHTWSSKIHQLD